MGDYTNAINYFEKGATWHGCDLAVASELRNALARGGIHGFWQYQWQATENDTNTFLYWKAVIQIHLGNTNAALDWLQKSCEKHEYGGMGGVSDPVGVTSPVGELLFYERNGMGCMTGNPRFKRLLDEVGFTKVMPNRERNDASLSDPVFIYTVCGNG